MKWLRNASTETTFLWLCSVWSCSLYSREFCKLTLILSQTLEDIIMMVPLLSFISAQQTTFVSVSFQKDSSWKLLDFTFARKQVSQTAVGDPRTEKTIMTWHEVNVTYGWYNDNEKFWVPWLAYLLVAKPVQWGYQPIQPKVSKFHHQLAYLSMADAPE